MNECCQPEMVTEQNHNFYIYCSEAILHGAKKSSGSMLFKCTIKNYKTKFSKIVITEKYHLIAYLTETKYADALNLLDIV